MSKKRSKTPSTSHKTTRKTEAPKVLARPSVEAPVEVSLEALPVVEPRTAPDHHQIARLAFAKFVARGYVHGHHIKDWLVAEAELMAR